MVTPECQICSTHGKPQEADTGVLCFNCSNDLLKILSDVELCTLAITAVPGQPKQGSGPIAASKPESKSPANDTAILHLDPRTAWSEEDGYGALATLMGWAAIVREELGLEQPAEVSVVTEAALLRSSHQHVVAQMWVVEYQEELKTVQRAVQRIVGLAPDKPLGPCRSEDCNGRVYPFEDGAQCRRCERSYRGLAMAEVKQGDDLGEMNRVPASLAVKALADYGTPVAAATLRKWVERGHLSKGDGYDMIELLEYVNRRKSAS